MLLGSLARGQVTSSESVRVSQKTATPSTATPEGTISDHRRQVKALNVAPDTSVITINGLCDNSPVGKTAASSCKTVITQAQFARVIEAIQPNMPVRARRDFALTYANALVMAKRAEQMGLDKGANYDEQMKLARIQILSKELSKAIQEEVAQVSYTDIEDYYNNNIGRFEKVEMERIYVPKSRQPPAASDKRLGEADGQDRSQESEQMKGEADILRARGVAGEEFSKLQVEAYQVAGIKSAAPQTSIKIRRTSLPPSQVSVMDLKPGEVSSVLADAGGYVIYKVRTKDTLPLDQAREEIRVIVRSQRMQAEIDEIQNSAAPTLDNSYFPPALPVR
jgi:PPIC-type PPIASE domain